MFSLSTATSLPARRRRVIVGGLTVSALLVACGGGGEEGGDTAAGEESTTRNTSLTIATGGTGGVYYPYGGAIANVISEDVPGVTATAQETNASVDNMLLLGSDQAQLAIVQGDTAADAVNGNGQFEEPLDFCALAVLYVNYFQVISTGGAGIQTMEDMRGKRISLGAPGSGSEVIALRLLEAAGIDPDTDIERLQLGVAETVAALQDGLIDAGFWGGGLPTGALVDLASTHDMVIIPTAEYEDELQEAFGTYYQAGEIPAGTYQGQDEAVPTIVAPNVLAARTDMDPQLQQEILQSIYDSKEELISVHPAAEELDPSTIEDLEFMDTCEGAQEYYDDAG